LVDIAWAFFLATWLTIVSLDLNDKVVKRITLFRVEICKCGMALPINAVHKTVHTRDANYFITTCMRNYLTSNTTYFESRYSHFCKSEFLSVWSIVLYLMCRLALFSLKHRVQALRISYSYKSPLANRVEVEYLLLLVYRVECSHGLPLAYFVALSIDNFCSRKNCERVQSCLWVVLFRRQHNYQQRTLYNRTHHFPDKWQSESSETSWNV